MTRSAKQTYSPRGSFDVDGMIETVKEFYVQAIADGYAGGRGTGEVSWVVGDEKFAQDLFTYEARLTQVLAEYPSTAICQYNARLFSGAELMDILSVHPYTIVHGQLIKNPYFIEPAQFLERYRAARS
jgi:hypothetical protein